MWYVKKSNLDKKQYTVTKKIKTSMFANLSFIASKYFEFALHIQKKALFGNEIILFSSVYNLFGAKLRPWAQTFPKTTAMLPHFRKEKVDLFKLFQAINIRRLHYF